MLVDTSTEFGARVERRLESELIVWLTTVSPAGQPFSIPIWFWWDGETVLVYSQPNTAKIRNINANPKVELHFDGNGTGGDIIRIAGEARVDEATPPATSTTEMMEKYQPALDRMNSTPEDFAQNYSIPIRITPTRVRGH